MAKIQLAPRSSAGVKTLIYVAASCWALGAATAGAQDLCCTLTPPVITKSASGPGGNGGVLEAPTPTAYAIAVAGPGEASASSSSETLVYDFGVFSSASGVSVPITIGGFVAYTVSGAVETIQFSTAYGANAEIDFEGEVIDDVSGSNNVVGPLSNQHIGVLFTNVLSDAIYTVTVSASAGANNTFVPDGFTDVTAFADPQVSFAPGFDSTGFTLEFSPGIVNGPSRDFIAIPGLTIPEPGSLTLVGVGAAGLLALAWRRRERRGFISA
jgi:hypothetical protein